MEQKGIETLAYRELLDRFNGLPVLKLLGALQLHSFNHGKTLRLEQMARLCLLELRKGNTSKPNANWHQLQEAIEGYREGIHLEEEPVAAFTENVVFAEGNYVVYPGGVYVNATRILNELLESIFLVKNSLPAAFKKLVNDGVGLLLFMSDLVARELQHTRNMYEENREEAIELPGYDEAMELVQELVFSHDLIKKICTRYNYDIKVLEDFVINITDPDLENDDPDKNPVNARPLIRQDDEVVLYMPASIANTLNEFIYNKAKEHDCYTEVVTLLQDRQFEKACTALKHMDWIEKNIPLPDDPLQLPVKEALFQFDNQKIGYLCFIGKRNPGQAPPKETASANPFSDRVEQVINHLSTIFTDHPRQVLCLFVVAATGDDYMLVWPKAPADHYSLMMTCTDLDAITYSEKSTILSLWKFAKAYDRANSLFRIVAAGGTLDAYVAWEENDGTFLSSDEANPAGATLFIPVGYSNNFLRRVHALRDEHAALIFYDQQVGYAKVTRYKQYAPIYTEKEQLIQDEGKVFRLVIETYKMPVWITSYIPHKKSSFSRMVCEGIAFWLHRLESHLGPFLDQLSFVQFEIEVIADVPDLQGTVSTVASDEAVVIDSRIVPPKIQIHIPESFMQLFSRPDNLADRLLMKTVLNGMNTYIEEGGEKVIFTEEEVSDIIEETLQQAGAKMFLLSDAFYNIRLDKTGLPPLVFIHEADISAILDNLTSYLPEGFPVPQQIEGNKNKRNLCITIVTALISQVEKKLALFNGANLLEWLIKLNEKYVYARELRDITIPAKIACFSSFEEEVNEFLQKGQDQTRASQAMRVLIEWVAACPPTGNRWPNFDEVEELLALVDQIISWGSEGDSIWKELSDPQMSLLPSGRIGIEKSFYRNSLSKYSFARATSEVFQFQENWASTYTNEKKGTRSAKAEKQQAELEIAFAKEFGITLNKLGRVTWSLVEEGLSKGKSCMVIPANEIHPVIQSRHSDITAAEIDTAINLLTLIKRNKIGGPPPGLKNEEIYPWRHKRSLSYLRRPLARMTSEKGEFYYYGYRHLSAYLENLHYLLYEGKLPGVQSIELKVWLGGISSGKGNPFREKAKQWFETETGFEVIPIEVDISPSGHLKADRDYGDIDLLVIDHENRRVYVIECKNISGGKTIYEMWSEISAYLGKDDKDEDAKIRKHKLRDQWLQANKEELKKFVTDPHSYEVISLVLTPDEIPLTYLRGHELPLPVKSFVFLRKAGLSYLSE